MPKCAKKTTSAIAKAMGKVSSVGAWSKTEPPRVLRTCVTSLNRGFRIGGIPTGMVGVFHGPSQGGKTILGTEVLRAAVATGGFGLLCDTEMRSNDMDWFKALHGSEALDLIFRWPEIDEKGDEEPRTYQSCVDKVQKVRKIFRKLKEDNEIPEEAFFAFVVDSIDRLIPEEELEDFEKNGIKGRGYPLRAMMNSLWLDKLVNTLRKDEVAVFIVRESTKIDAGPYQRKWKMRGGKALEFDSGWIVRVGSGDEGASSNTTIQVALPGHKDKVKIGEKHDLFIRKSSTSNKLGQRGCFFIGSGLSDEMPLGFDRAREIREEAITRKVLVKLTANKDRKAGYYLTPEAAAAMGIDVSTGVASRDKLTGWIGSTPGLIEKFSAYLNGEAVSWAELDDPSVVVDDESEGNVSSSGENE